MHKLLNDENASIKNSRILISNKSFDSPVKIFIYMECVAHLNIYEDGNATIYRKDEKLH